MRGEYEAIAAAGVTVQIDGPDLAMGRHIQYADLSVEEFRKRYVGRGCADRTSHVSNRPPLSCREIV